MISFAKGIGPISKNCMKVKVCIQNVLLYINKMQEPPMYIGLPCLKKERERESYSSCYNLDDISAVILQVK